MQNCMIYPMPTSHFRNLNEETGTDDFIPNPSTSYGLPPSPNHAILILTNAFKTAIKENRIHTLKGLSKQFLHQLDSNLEFFMYHHSDLEACYQTQMTSSTPTPPTQLTPLPPLNTVFNLVPVSNLLNLKHLPGAANLQTSTPNCRPSWTGSTWPKLKIMLNWLSLNRPSLLLNEDLSTTSLTELKSLQTFLLYTCMVYIPVNYTLHLISEKMKPTKQCMFCGALLGVTGLGRHMCK